MARLIVPPTDIRVIIEKTAGFVAKNGSEFEAKIHENERHNLKFAFMNPNDPYNMYYRKRLQELIESGTNAIMMAITDSKASEAQASSRMDKSGVIGSIESEKLLESNEEGDKVVNLESLEFLVELPSISAVDLDVLKLTAQFAAKNGKQFILHLSQKESRNPQFDFLKPHHNLHQFYQALLKQYSLVLSPSINLINRVKICAFNQSEHLKIVKQRSQLERLDRQRIQEQIASENAEQEAFNKIDWHDFSVAETVTFGPEDQHKDFPSPINPEILSHMPISQRLEMWTGTTINSQDSTDEIEMEIEMEIDEPSVVIPKIISNNEIVMGAAFGTGAPIKVRTDYVPRSSLPVEVETQICTICKASIPISQIDEHIRIELLDPKWRTQRLAMLEKNKDSNLVETGTDVSRNLEALAKHRGDIFGSISVTGASTSTASDTIERGPTRPIWDGHADSIGQINRAAQILSKPQIAKEMEALQSSGDYSLDPSKGIGPRFVGGTGNNLNNGGNSNVANQNYTNMYPNPTSGMYMPMTMPMPMHPMPMTMPIPMPMPQMPMTMPMHPMPMTMPMPPSQGMPFPFPFPPMPYPYSQYPPPPPPQEEEESEKPPKA